MVLWPSIFSTGTVQQRLADNLAREHRVLLIDPPGHGASWIDCSDALTMAACATATLALLDRLDVRQARWVGTSWGGLVGLEAARLAPARIQHLACLNTPFSFVRSRWSKPAWIPTMARLIGTSALFANGVAEDFFLPATRASSAAAEAMAAHHQVFARGDRRQLAAAAQLIFERRKDAMPDLHAVTPPVLVVAGTKDRLYDVAMQREAASKLPRGTFVEMSTAHIAAVDASDDVTRSLRTAWAALGSAG